MILEAGPVVLRLVGPEDRESLIAILSDADIMNVLRELSTPGV
jgi:hypothetical protein